MCLFSHALTPIAMGNVLNDGPQCQAFARHALIPIGMGNVFDDGPPCEPFLRHPQSRALLPVVQAMRARKGTR